MTNPPTLAGLRFLVVEDDALIAMLMEDLLQELGCEVVGPEASVASALDVIRMAPIDVALLDLNLGRGETSYPIADALVAGSVPFAFVTGGGAYSLREPYQAQPTLQKPFRMDELEKVLSRLAGIEAA